MGEHPLVINFRNLNKDVPGPTTKLVDFLEEKAEKLWRDVAKYENIDISSLSWSDMDERIKDYWRYTVTNPGLY